MHLYTYIQTMYIFTYMYIHTYTFTYIHICISHTYAHIHTYSATPRQTHETEEAQLAIWRDQNSQESSTWSNRRSRPLQITYSKHHPPERGKNQWNCTEMNPILLR